MITALVFTDHLHAGVSDPSLNQQSHEHGLVCSWMNSSGFTDHWLLKTRGTIQFTLIMIVIIYHIFCLFVCLFY